MKVIGEIRVEQQLFQVAIEGLEFPEFNFGGPPFAPTEMLVTLISRDNGPYALGSLEFREGNRLRGAWPDSVPNDVQAWIDAKLIEVNEWRLRPAR